jgi:hypothetical protein
MNKIENFNQLVARAMSTPGRAAMRPEGLKTRNSSSPEHGFSTDFLHYAKSFPKFNFSKPIYLLPISVVTL